MSRRAWYVVFGAIRIENDQNLSQRDIAERISTLYNDVEFGDISGIIDNYLEHRGQTNVES